MADGNYKIWRGRESLSKLTGLSTKTISKARRELIDAGVFLRSLNRENVSADGKRLRPVARGVIALEVVRNPDKFLAARKESRAELERAFRRDSQIERLQAQRLLLTGQIDADELARRERAIESDWQKAQRTHANGG